MVRSCGQRSWRVSDKWVTNTKGTSNLRWWGLTPLLPQVWATAQATGSQAHCTQALQKTDSTNCLNCCSSVCLQDDDGHLLRVQPAHSVPSGGTGVARRKRMGRPGAGTGRLMWIDWWWYTYNLDWSFVWKTFRLSSVFCLSNWLKTFVSLFPLHMLHAKL